VTLLVAFLMSLPLADVPSDGATIVIEKNRVAIEARETPLTAVLALLADRADIQVVYDGPEPTQAITVTVSAPTLEEAVASLLEGQHLRYGLSADSQGRVAALVVVTRSGVAATPLSSPRTAHTPVPTLPPGTRPDPVASIQEPPMQDHPSPPDE
jgi:hypothetical protein